MASFWDEGEISCAQVYPTPCKAKYLCDYVLLLFQTSYADTHFLAVYDAYCHDAIPEAASPSTILTNYPKLKSIVEKTKSLPGVAKYLENRPETPF